MVLCFAELCAILATSKQNTMQKDELLTIPRAEYEFMLAEPNLIFASFIVEGKWRV
jgi:hypothetical protein